jgi:hypothetical protein
MTQQPARGPESDILPPVPLRLPADPTSHPGVVAPDVVDQMKDPSAGAAPSEGTGVSGNLSGIEIQPPPPSAGHA